MSNISLPILSDEDCKMLKHEIHERMQKFTPLHGNLCHDCKGAVVKKSPVGLMENFSILCQRATTAIAHTITLKMLTLPARKNFLSSSTDPLRSRSLKSHQIVSGGFSFIVV